MNKILASMVFCVLTAASMSAVAAPPSDLDLSLMESGVVDQNYKYKDLEAVTKIFTVLDTQMKTMFPVEVLDGMEATSVSISPYKSTYIYSYTVDMSKDTVSDLKKEFANPSVLSTLCADIFMTERFFSANDHRMAFIYKLKNGEKLADIQINNTTCKV